MEEPINTPEKLKMELILRVLIWVLSKNSERIIILNIVQKTFMSNFLSSSFSFFLSRISFKAFSNSVSFLFSWTFGFNWIEEVLVLVLILLLVFSILGKLYPSFFILKCFVSSLEASTSEIVSNLAFKGYLWLFRVSSFFSIFDSSNNSVNEV